MQKISTNTLITRKQVEIDGHHYTVRKYGAGEQLRLNQLIKEANTLEKKLAGLKEDSEDQKSIDRAEHLGREMIDLFVGLFDDHGDGSKSRALVESLSQEEVQLLFKQIFDEQENTSEPADTTSKTSTEKA